MKKLFSSVLVLTLILGLVAPGLSVRAADQSSTTAPSGWTPAGVHAALQFLPVGVPVLVLEDAYPWGTSSHISLLLSLGYAPRIATWSDLGVTVSLSDYRNVYVASDQPQGFYDAYAAHAAELTAWVSAGGHLVFSACDNGWNDGDLATPLPGGAVKANNYAGTNVVVDPAHPIATGELSDGIPLASPFSGTSASHSYFSVLPLGAHVIFRDGSLKPTLVEYALGSGLVVASGLTWEYGYSHSQGSKPAFDDLFLYAFPKVTYTLKATAGLGGTIAPSGDVVVFEGSSKTFVITAGAGNSIVSVVVDGMPVMVTDQTTMTYTFSAISANHTIQAMFMSPDRLAPTIAFPLELMGSATVRYHSLALLLDVRDDKGDAFVQVWVSGVKAAEGSQNGPHTYNLSLAEGANTIYVTATDAAGNMADATLKVTADSTAPVLSAHIVKNGTAVSVVGSAVDSGSGLRSLVVGEQEVAVGLDGDFSVPVQPKPGMSSIVIEATDNVGNTATLELALTQAYKPVSSYKTITLTIGKAAMDVNGMSVAMDAAPVIKNGRTLLPIRALIETLGGKVTWNAKTRTATVVLGERSVVLEIGKGTALVNGKSVPIDASNAKVVPEIIGNRTFLPLRFIAESLGLDLAWEPVSQTISFTYWP